MLQLATYQSGIRLALDTDTGVMELLFAPPSKTEFVLGARAAASDTGLGGCAAPCAVGFTAEQTAEFIPGVAHRVPSWLGNT